jgi:sulfatase maturation enzyme AslB (radical SAM superfamily)
MDNSKVFCMTPWFEVHINADGSYHTCGAQPNPLKVPISHDFVSKYNVQSMSIPEWINSDYQQKARSGKLIGEPEPRCSMCYNEEQSGSSSKRIRENLKSQITPDEFESSFKSSPHYPVFMFSSDHHGLTDMLRPVSYHMSLGNECNYACKMCGPWASSRLAVEGIKDGTYQGPAKLNWTENDQVWDSVTDYICSTENLQAIHLIGGEPMLNPKFENLIDKLIAANRTNIYLGFTTNGSIVSRQLIEKLNVFRHVDIGISIECAGMLNDFVRKGTNTQQVLDNIDTYLEYRKEAHVYITARTVPSALTVHTLDELYSWCVSRKLDVFTNILTYPDYMQIQHLPREVKSKLLDQYNQWQFSEPLPGTSDPRDPNRYREHIDNEIRAVINLLQRENDPKLTEILYQKIQSWGWFDFPQIKKYFMPEIL